MDSLTCSLRNFFAKTKVGASYRMSFIEGKIGINECGDDSFLDGKLRAEFIAKYTSAATESLLSAKFEAEIIHEIFIRFQKKVVQLMEVEKFECVNKLYFKESSPTVSYFIIFT